MEPFLGLLKAVRAGVFAGLIPAITLAAMGGSDTCVAAAPQDKARPEASSTTDKTKTKPAKPRTGLIVNDPRAYQGYTLLAPILSKMVYLLDIPTAPGRARLLET
jgi:hypothetical protein